MFVQPDTGRRPVDWCVKCLYCRNEESGLKINRHFLVDQQCLPLAQS